MGPSQQKRAHLSTPARLLVIGGGALVAFAGFAAAAASVAHGAGDDTRTLLSLANRERAAAGIPPLAEDATASAVAQTHCRVMATQQRLFHSEPLGAGVTGWTAAGENVGVGVSVRKVHDAFMASPAHRANILRRAFSVTGMCAVKVRGAYWVTEIFFDRVGAATARTAVPSNRRPRRPTNAAAAASLPSAAAARAPVTPARRRLPKKSPVARASRFDVRSVTQLVRVVSLDLPATARRGDVRVLRGQPTKGAGAWRTTPALVADARRRWWLRVPV